MVVYVKPKPIYRQKKNYTTAQIIKVPPAHAKRVLMETTAGRKTNSGGNENLLWRMFWLDSGVDDVTNSTVGRFSRNNFYDLYILLLTPLESSGVIDDSRMYICTRKLAGRIWQFLFGSPCISGIGTC
jgi:hypothetical protein